MGEFGPLGDGSEVGSVPVGSHDHDEYVPIVDPVDIRAVHTFSPQNSGDTPPFRTTSSILVDALNADLLDGYHANELLSLALAAVAELEVRVESLEGELEMLRETNDLLRRILAEVTKQSIIASEVSGEIITDADVKEVWQ